MPEYEEREAARHAHTSWREWEEMSWQERAYGLAYYRLQHLVEAHSHEASERRSKQLARRSKGAAGRRRR